MVWVDGNEVKLEGSAGLVGDNTQNFFWEKLRIVRGAMRMALTQRIGLKVIWQILASFWAC